MLSYLVEVFKVYKKKLILYIFSKIKYCKFPLKSKKLLLVRLDSIGDYVLFRNFIEDLKNDATWGQYSFTLLGNESFRDLAEHLDNRFISEFIWIKPDDLVNRYFVAKLSLKIKFKCFDVLINSVHSRAPWLDRIFFLLGCKYLIGSKGDLAGSPSFEDETGIGYNLLVPSLSYHSFEFYRNQYFFSSITSSAKDTKFSIPFRPSQYLDISFFNILIFPGAGASFREWSSLNFSKLIEIISRSDKATIRFYILGSSQDFKLANSIQEKCGMKNVINLAGTTPLRDVVNIIGSSNLVISNDSSAIHIAAATKTRAICISNGNHFGRFNPYPSELVDYIYTVYPDERFYSNDTSIRNELIEKYKYISEIDINLIAVDKVMKWVIGIMGNQSIEQI